ncbi:hypothetical protein ACWC1D_25535 [Streptomyces sp. NPDC001478]
MARIWRTEDGAPLYLALLSERAHFDRAHGRADSHSATEYLKFESGTRRLQAPAGHQWADQLEVGDLALLEMDDDLRPFDIRSRTISPSGLVTLVLDTDDTVLLARNMTVPSDTTHPVTADGVAYADAQAGWAVPEGAWVELDPTDLDPELQQSLEHPRLGEPGSRIRAKLNGRDDETYSIRLGQVRLITADQERHPLTEDLVIEQPDLLVRLRPFAASAEELPRVPIGQPSIPGDQELTLSDLAPAAADGLPSRSPDNQQPGAADTSADRSQESTPAPKAGRTTTSHETTGQRPGTAPPSSLPEPDKQRRAQQIADEATAATLPEQVRVLWESARKESLPPATPVDTPKGTRPLVPYLTARGQDLVASTSATDAVPAAEHTTPSPEDAPSGTGTTEPPVPHNADTTEADPTRQAPLYELASSALSSEQAPTAPTVLGDLNGITIYHVVSAEPPETTDLQTGSRWLYLGLTDDTSNLPIPIAVISDSDLSRLTASDFEHAVSAWAHAAEPVLVNLSGIAEPMRPPQPAKETAREKTPATPANEMMTARTGEDESRPPRASGGPDAAKPRHDASDHRGAGASNEIQLTTPTPDIAIATEADDGARESPPQDNDGSHDGPDPQSHRERIGFQHQPSQHRGRTSIAPRHTATTSTGATSVPLDTNALLTLPAEQHAEAPGRSLPTPATARSKPVPPRAETTNADTEEHQASPQAPFEPGPEPPRAETAAHPEGPQQPPGTNTGTVLETQVLQAAVQNKAEEDTSDQDPERHISALRELFEALAATASGANASTVNVPTGASAEQETKPARPGIPPAFTRARADLDPHIEAINGSPRATPQIRTELGALIAQIDRTLPQLNRIRASQRPTLWTRALDLLVHTAERLKVLATRLHAPAVSQRIEQLTERLRGSRPEPANPLLAPRGDRRLQAYASTQRIIESQLATPGLPRTQRHTLQEEWILNRARWHSHYKIHHGEPPEGLIPHDRNRIAGYPTTPSLRPKSIRELGDHLRKRATDLAAVPATAAQAELFTIVAATYEQQGSSTTSTPPSPLPPLKSVRSQPVTDRPDVCAAARRLADEATKRAARAAGTASPPQNGDPRVTTHTEQLQTAQPASASAGRGTSPP